MKLLRRPISRRTLLRGAGVTMALPFLGAMAPRRAAAVGPRRAVFVCLANGADMDSWTPREEGALGALPESLSPLADLRDEMMVLSGLDLDVPYAPDPNTDHTASNLLCCRQPRFAGDGLNVGGPSIDRVIASSLGTESLVVGNEDGPSYQKYYSWDDETRPHPVEIDPANAFDALFAGATTPTPMTDETAERRRAQRRSVLDFLRDDSARLSNTLGTEDRARLDEYQTSIRELEMRIAGMTGGAGGGGVACDADGRPSGGASYQERVGLMYDIIAKALECDRARVVSYGLQQGLAGTAYNFLGSGFGDHHTLSHDDRGRLAQVVQWHVERFASFIRQLRDAREGDASVLDNSMVFFGSHLSDGLGDHWHTDLPVVLAGRGGGAIRPGRHVRFSTSDFYWNSHDRRGTPIANLYLTIAEQMGAGVTGFADGTATLDLT